jgi:16S rRNA (guanine966-N2)-methyltransferase
MVRITGGAWRGRRLEVPRGVRPTTELARKAAFDILGDAILGARVLDACAGSGAYGLEALSRGAAHATFVEADRKVAETLRGNLERLGAGERASVEEMSVERLSSSGREGRAAARGDDRPAARRAGAPPATFFDVVFHDPPFEEESESDLRLLLSLVKAGGWVFHERADKPGVSPGSVAPADVRRYGRTRFLIYRP